MSCSHHHQHVRRHGVITAPKPHVRGPAHALWDAFLLLTALPREWSARVRERRALEQMDDHLLRDIGLDRDTVRDECSTPFWRK